MVKIKVCGITNFEDASKACFYGAYALGFIFHKKSPRYISPSKARKIIDQLPPFITPVGVFVDLSERAVKDICRFTGIRTVQFHGKEDPSYCNRFKDCKVIKVFRVEDEVLLSNVERYNVDAYLFDTFKQDQHGGTGEVFDWRLLEGVKFKKPVILSGGLNSENVKQAIEAVKPQVIDVCSGVEKSPGVKNPRLIRAFFDIANF
jgi:phosphoribosylanthranilate isomerase